MSYSDSSGALITTDVGVRDLKANLSAYVQRAANGERIRVTDRGVPKAMLVALAGESRIEQGIREGWITPGNRLRGVMSRLPEQLGRIKQGMSSVDELREDRDA